MVRSEMYLLLLLFAWTTASTQSGYKGKAFWLVFQQNASADAAPYKPRLIIVGPPETRGIVRLTALAKEIPFTLPKDPSRTAFRTIPIDTTYFVTQQGIHAITIEVTADNDISVTAVSERTGSTDIYQVLPAHKLGLEYAIIGYDPFPKPYSYATQFDLIATEDSTDITMELPHRKQHTSIHLNKGQAAHFKGIINDTLYEYTGTIVHASKPIGVITGHSCAQIPAGTDFCNALMEMLPAVESMGKEYPIPKLLNPYSIRVVATHDNTEVLLNGKNATTLQRGEYYEKSDLEDNVLVTTSEKVYVMQYNSGCGADQSKSDPFMLLIAPTHAFIKEVEFVCPMRGVWLHHINIVTSVDGIEDIRLDRLTIPSKYFTQIPNTDLVAAQIEIGYGSHNLSSSFPFAAYLYGYGVADESFDTYGTLLGME